MTPFAPIFFPLIPLFIFGVGKGLAWYWCQLTGQTLTDDLTNFSVATTAFVLVTDYICLGINKYVARTVGEADEEKPFGLKDKLYGLLVVIIVAIGWLVLELVRPT